MKFGRKILDSKLSYGENVKSLSHLVLDQYRVMTNKWTDERTELP